MFSACAPSIVAKIYLQPNQTCPFFRFLLHHVSRNKLNPYTLWWQYSLLALTKAPCTGRIWQNPASTFHRLPELHPFRSLHQKHQRLTGAGRTRTYKTQNARYSFRPIGTSRLKMFSSRLTLFAALALRFVRADQNIIVDGASGLSSGWEDWSWSTTETYGASGGQFVVGAWGAVSLYAETAFDNNYAGLQFEFTGDPTQVQFYIQSTVSNGQSPTIGVSAMSKTWAATGPTTVVLNFGNLPPAGTVLGNDTWNRLNFQALGNGATVSPTFNPFRGCITCSLVPSLVHPR